MAPQSSEQLTFSNANIVAHNGTGNKKLKQEKPVLRRVSFLIDESIRVFGSCPAVKVGEKRQMSHSREKIVLKSGSKLIRSHGILI